jgi:hypothetical protein
VIRYLTLIALVGCAEFGLENAGSDRTGSDTAEFADSANSQPIRLDVYAESATELGLLNQSFFVDAHRTEDMTLQLKAPIAIRGSLQGFQTFPTSDVQVPGNLSAVPGQFRCFVPNSLMSYAVKTDASGDFSFLAVPSEGYTLAWIPDIGVNLPFEVEEGVPLLEDTVFNKVLSYTESQVIFGRIKDNSGLGIPDLQFAVTDTHSGISNSGGTTNNMGAFQTRLYPGDYSLRIQGNSHDALPSIQKQLIVSEDGDSALQAEIQLGKLDTVKADGRVLGPDGSALGNVLVRFTATDLDEHPSLDFSTESTTGSNGRYSIPVLPGRYNVAFIPNHDGPFSPVLVTEIELSAAVTELDPTRLQERPLVNGRLLDAFGMPAEGAIVRAQEQGFDGAVFEAFTGELGVFSIAVSDGPLFWTFVPDQPSQGAITFADSSSTALDGRTIQLEEGQLVSGCIAHADGDVIFAPVEVRDRKDLLYASTFTDDQGCFAVRVDLSGMN